MRQPSRCFVPFAILFALITMAAAPLAMAAAVTQTVAFAEPSMADGAVVMAGAHTFAVMMGVGARPNDLTITVLARRPGHLEHSQNPQDR